MAFAEFCCRSGGSNMNGGGLASGAEPSTTPVYSATNGGWNSATGVFTPTSGNPSATVTVGDFASVFIDGATTPVFIGRVTAVSSTTVTVSTTVKSGTAPTTAGTGISINVGGAWKGPNAAVAFPFGFITAALINAAGNMPRVNFKNDASYLITAAISHSNTTTYFEGYTTTFGDGGIAVLDAQSNAIVPLTIGGVFVGVGCFEIKNNGTTGTAHGLVHNGSGYIWRVITHAIRGTGIVCAGSPITVQECEAYDCNRSNSVNLGGFVSSSGGVHFVRCVSHDNNTAGSNSHGFVLTGNNVISNCIAASNVGIGIFALGTSGCIVHFCDAYNNTMDGIRLASGGGTVVSSIENCNLIKNGGFGINITPADVFGKWFNNGFGAGTQVNTSGSIVTLPAGSPVTVTGSVNYASGVTPWVDPANGDFRINLTAAKGAGRGAYVETAAGYAGTVAYPDIGAAQHQDTGGGGGAGGVSRGRAMTGM